MKKKISDASQEVKDLQIALNEIMLQEKVDIVNIHFKGSYRKSQKIAQDILNYLGKQIIYSKWYDFNQIANIMLYHENNFYGQVYVCRKGLIKIVFKDKTYKEVELLLQMLCVIISQYANKDSIYVEIFKNIYLEKITYPVILSKKHQEKEKEKC